MRRFWVEGGRDLLPWGLAGFALWLLVAVWWPDTACRWRDLRAETAHLRTIAPGPETLRERLRGAILDSSARGRLRGIATLRMARGSDPSSQVAGIVVPLLESKGVKLLRVSARQEGREVLLSLSVQASWKELLGGLGALDSLPFAWTTRRLSLRPADNFRLWGDLVLGVPTAPSEAPGEVAP